MRSRRITQLVAAVGFSSLLALSCSWEPKTPPSIKGERARAQTPALSSAASCDFDLAGDKADTVFFILGLLDEYNGRNIVEDSDHVERFYCNEANTAHLFRRYLGTLAQEQGLNPAVREETSQQCLVSSYFKPIADRLNSCYRYEMTDQMAQASDGDRRTAHPSLLASGLFTRGRISWITEKGLSEGAFFRRRALAYLAGAWARYGRGNDFVFANAHDKAALVESLLSALGCSRISLESTYGLAPQANIVHFQPTDEVTEWLRKTW